MGSEAFGSDSDYFDLTGCNSIGDLDTSAGVVELDAGATWPDLMNTLTHLDKAEAFRVYLDFYLQTTGQLCAGDRQQMSTYLPDYHEVVAAAVWPEVAQSPVITADGF